jgi:hypothetical protein
VKIVAAGVALAALVAIAALRPALEPPIEAAAPDVAAQALLSLSQSDDEFVGPFASWVNIRTAYGAAGDGVADDTAAFERAFSDVGREDRSPVLYVPSGRYRITRTLALVSHITVTIAGEDPAATVLLWDGAAGGTMLSANGLAYSRLTRLTFDGQHRASVAIEQSWDNQRPQFDTGNEYSDVVFRNVEYGIHGGFTGHGFAETSITRARFAGNSKAGVALGNFNALDIWVRESIFEDCAVGVTNDSGAGNNHVYDSVFLRSTVADMAMQNTGGFSARGNVSVGSKAFFVSGVSFNHPATVVLQDNIVVDFADESAIRLTNEGPGVLLDNVFVSRERAAGPVVTWRSFYDADVASIGNVYTAATPIFNNGRLVTLDDRILQRQFVPLNVPRVPGFRPVARREIVEVPAGANAAAIQAAIDGAASRAGRRPVVHLPYGRYAIDRTLVVPASDVQLVGDGARTVLDWTGDGDGPVVRIAGPSRATLRELSVRGAGRADGIVTANLDRAGSRVYLEGVQLTAARESNLAVDGLRSTIVHVVDGNHLGSRGASVRVSGGDLRIYSAASSNNALSYDVSGRGRLLVRDAWYEGAPATGFLAVRNQAEVTLDGGRVSTPRDAAVAAVSVANLDGRLTLLGTHFDDRVVVRGDGSKAEIAALALFREFSPSPFFTNDTTPPARATLLNLRQRPERAGTLSAGSTRLDDVGRPEAEAWRRMLELTRSAKGPALLDAVPGSASDLRLFRVWISDGLTNLLLQ